MARSSKDKIRPATQAHKKVVPVAAKASGANRVHASNPHPVLTLTPEGIVMYCNPSGEALLRLSGYKAGSKLDENLCACADRVYRRNIPAKCEFAAGQKSYSLTFTKDDNNRRVTVYGFDITEIKRVEHQLRQEVVNSEDRVRSVIETATCAVVSTDSHGKIVYWNPAAERMFGYTSKQCHGKPISRIIPERFRKRHNEAMKNVASTGKFKSVERKLELVGLREDGSEFPVELTLSNWNIGVETFFTGVIRDLTEQKKVEARLAGAHTRIEQLKAEQAEMEKYDGLLQGLGSIGMGVDIISNDYIILWQNSVLLEVFGDLNGKCCFESYVGRIEPCDNCPMRRSIESGHVEKAHIKGADGRYYEIYSAPLPEPDGSVTKAIEVVIDIDDRRQAEQELVRLTAILENTSDMVSTSTPQEQLTYLNAAGRKMLGWEDDENIAGKKISDTHPKWAFDLVKNEGIPGAIRDGMWSGETALLNRDGKEIPASQVIMSHRSPSGEIEYFSTIIRDITERKRAQEAISEKSTEMEKLLHIVTHDLRSPLVNIQGFSAELQESCKKVHEIIGGNGVSKSVQQKLSPILTDEVPEAMNFITASTQKMDTLLKGLNKLAKVGRVEINIQQLEMNPMMQRIVESVRFQAKKTGALVEVEELPDCMGDEVQTNQVFSNLVDNALKYLDPERKGLIRIKGWMQEGRSIYCVEDNGLGIPKNHQGKIFEVFHRVNPKGSVSGEGIGLTTVKQILDRQGGRIWLESEAGKSSRFFVSLPGKK